MFSPKVIVSQHTGVKSDIRPTSYFSTDHYHKQLNDNHQSSFQEAIKLASQVNMKHDANGCYQCDQVAGYYMTALGYAKRSEPIQCNSDLFDLVWHMTNLVLSHRETNKYQRLNWFDTVAHALWDFAKRLKEESFECDLHVPTNGKRGSIDSTSSTASSSSENEDENYRRAIRITIYNCRAQVCEQANEEKQAIVYYRKCASVRPTPFEAQQHLQQTALATMQRLIESSRPTIKQSFTSDSISTISTSSSTTLSRPMVSCSNCGIEKLVMPVCARCKTQPYCSVRCIKSHKTTHSATCSS
jgi:hypothetical protein